MRISAITVNTKLTTAIDTESTTTLSHVGSPGMVR